MKKHTQLGLALITFLTVCVMATQVCAQGNFQNLNFESAILPTIPPDQFGSLEPIASALPSWTGYIATGQQTQVLHNNYSLGLPSLGILGPLWNKLPAVIEGNFSAVIQAGFDLISNTQQSAALAQTALIPVSANSIQMKVKPFLATDINQLNVMIGGQNITMIPITSTSSYILLGGDVSTFSGLTRELRITALPAPTYANNSFLLDSIIFSNQPIPEPSPLALFGLGTLFLGWRSVRRR